MSIYHKSIVIGIDRKLDGTEHKFSNPRMNTFIFSETSHGRFMDESSLKNVSPKIFVKFVKLL